MATGLVQARSHTLTSLPSVLRKAPLYRLPNTGDERVQGRLTQGSKDQGCLRQSLEMAQLGSSGLRVEARELALRC